VFGQADWKVTDKLTLTAGVRETQDPVQSGPQTTLFLDPLVPPPFGPQLTLSQSGVLRHTFSAATWNVAATYKIDPELNVYGTIRRGFKEGGFNGTAQNAADRFFQPEFDTDYEFGIKGQHDIGGVRTRFDVDGFYDDYTGIQRFENIVESGIPQTLTKNVGVGSIAGVDVDFTAIANEYFRVSLNYTYLDAKYSKFDDVADGNPKSSRFPNTPSHQLTVTPMVTIPVPSHFGELTAQANIYHQSSIATDPFNVPNGFYSVDADSPGANIPGYTRVDLRADWRHIYGSSVSAALFVQNVADTKYVIGSNNQLNAATMTVADLYGEPRFFGIEFRYDFGR
jgi:iron complex outermembrane receptor protein